MKKIIWIASYPKSGNTYLRSFLSYYLYNSNSEFNFDLLSQIPKFETRKIFKKALDPKIFTNKFKYNEYFLKVQKELIKKLDQKKLIFKTHHFFGELNNHVFTNNSTTLLFIYLVRDPREVLVSFSNHNKMTIDEQLETFVKDNVMRKVKMEVVVNWDVHYRSWKSFKSVPSMFIKFEDLVQKPKEVFHGLLSFLSEYIEIEVNENLLEKTIELTKFNNLKKLENQFGFKEAPSNNVFFNSGKIDSWKKILNHKQVNQVEDKFGKEMKELGYI